MSNFEFILRLQEEDKNDCENWYYENFGKRADVEKKFLTNFSMKIEELFQKNLRECEDRLHFDSLFDNDVPVSERYLKDKYLTILGDSYDDFILAIRQNSRYHFKLPQHDLSPYYFLLQDEDSMKKKMMLSYFSKIYDNEAGYRKLGFGILRINQKRTYLGEVTKKNDSFYANGKGLLFGDSEPTFIGKFRKSRKEGRGMEIKKLSEDIVNCFFISFVGEYLNDQRHGEGIEYSVSKIPHTELSSICFYRAGKRHGKSCFIEEEEEDNENVDTSLRRSRFVVGNWVDGVFDRKRSLSIPLIDLKFIDTEIQNNKDNIWQPRDLSSMYQIKNYHVESSSLKRFFPTTTNVTSSHFCVRILNIRDFHYFDFKEDEEIRIFRAFEECLVDISKLISLQRSNHILHYLAFIKNRHHHHSEKKKAERDDHYNHYLNTVQRMKAMDRFRIGFVHEGIDFDCSSIFKAVKDRKIKMGRISFDEKIEYFRDASKVLLLLHHYCGYDLRDFRWESFVKTQNGNLKVFDVERFIRLKELNNHVHRSSGANYDYAWSIRGSTRSVSYQFGLMMYTLLLERVHPYFSGEEEEEEESIECPCGKHFHSGSDATYLSYQLPQHVQYCGLRPRRIDHYLSNEESERYEFLIDLIREKCWGVDASERPSLFRINRVLDRGMESLKNGRMQEKDERERLKFLLVEMEGAGSFYDGSRFVTKLVMMCQGKKSSLSVFKML